MAYVVEPSDIWEPVSAPSVDVDQPKDLTGSALPRGGDLMDWAQYQFTLEASRAAKLGFPVASVSGSTSDIVMIREFSRSVQLEHEDSVRGRYQVRYGVAVRLVVETQKLDAQGRTDLPWVALQVELKNQSASARLDITGYIGTDIAAQLPPMGKDLFDLENYITMMKSLTDLQTTIGNNPDKIRPVPLQQISLAPESEDAWVADSRRAVGIAWALTKLVQGRSCEQAKKELEYGEIDKITSEQRVSAIEQTYKRILGRSPCDKMKPTVVHRERAKELLRPYSLKDEWPPG